MEAPVLSRRDRERLVRRRAMLDAALTVFAEKGFQSATLDEVAERAEFGKGTLYNYFAGGKEAILFALFDEVYADVVNLIETYFERVESERPTRDVFHGFIAETIAHLVERSDAFMLMAKEAHRMAFSEERENAAYFLGQRERIAAALALPIEKAMQAGTLRRMDAHGVAHMLMGNIHGYLMYACPLGEHAPTAPPDAEHGANLITTILFDGLLPRD